MAASRDDEVVVPQPEDGPASVLVPFVSVLRRPGLLLLSLGVPLAIGILVGVGSSSVPVGLGAFLVAAVAPVLILLGVTWYRQPWTDR